MLKIDIPFPPSVNRLWRTSVNGGMYCSSKYTAWRSEALWAIVGQTRGKTFVGPYKLTLLARKPDKRHRDLDNLLKAASDALVGAKAIQSDHLCQHIEAKWVTEGPDCTVIIEAA